MLKHLNSEEKKPNRVLILGSQGFIGSAIYSRLEKLGVTVLGLGSKDLNLTSPDAAEKLISLLDPKDMLVFVSARAPCKDLGMLLENIQMGKSACDALKVKPVSHVVYISSDAVYGDSDKPMTEDSSAAPSSTHGVMHLAREIGLQQDCSGPLAIVRPTLVYGLNDPHNGYGPNRFRRLAAEGKEIVLFGEGEERRDHVDVEDIAELISMIILRKSVGIINAVSGDVVSFKELAGLAASSFESVVAVRGTTRSGPMPHNGYRAFDNSAVAKAFPGFQFKSWKEGLTKVNQLYKAQISK
jgi:nucleoside-diphosphate-sugar epimerase